MILEPNQHIENSLSIARFIQGKYLKDIEGLFPSVTYTFADLPFEVLLEYCEEKGVELKPMTPTGFSQDFQVKRIYLQVPFGDFVRINAFKSKNGDKKNQNYVELHEGIYVGKWNDTPFAVVNLQFYLVNSQTILYQMLFVPKDKSEIKDEIVSGFADYMTDKITKTRPFQVDNTVPYIIKPSTWEKMYGIENKISEYKLFVESRLHPKPELLKSYEDALPALTIIGPSGCGKSYLVNVIMSQYKDFKFFMFRPSDEISPFAALDFIERSKRYPKRLYIFEELDTLAETMNGLQVWRQVIEQGVEKGSGHVAMVIATSSYPEILKTAVEFRPDLFGAVWRFEYPNETVRKSYLIEHGHTNDITEDGWKTILNETDGFSYAWLKEIMRNCAFTLSENQKVHQEKALLDSIRELKSRVNSVKDKFPSGLNKQFGFSVK